MNKAGGQLNLAIALCLITLGVVMRLLPHPANFAPIAAIAIFGGSVLPRRLAIWVPVGAMMVSDFFIGLHNLILLTWGCYFLIALASSRWLQKPTLRRGALLTVSGSVGFYVITNFGVWVTSGMYAHTWSGLVSCYTLALPFFRNTVLSDLVYTGALFGLYALATSEARRLVKSSSAAV
jgi:hypothetical protein